MRACVYLASVILFSSVFTNFAAANVSGTHLQNFNPTTNGLDFVTVHSSKTLQPAHFNLGVFFNYATNSLPFFKAPGVASGQKFSEPNDNLLAGDLNLGVGLLDGWDVGLSLPMILSQDINNSTQLGSYDDTGITEFRINTKYRVYTQDDWGVALVGRELRSHQQQPFRGERPADVEPYTHDHQFTSRQWAERLLPSATTAAPSSIRM